MTPITVATNTPGTPIPVGTNPAGLAITPDGKTAYVTNLSGASVTPITVATNTVGTPIPVGAKPSEIAITPATTPTPTPTPTPVPTRGPGISALCSQNHDFGFSHGACVSLIQSNLHGSAIFPSLCKNLQQQVPADFNAVFKNIDDCVSSLNKLLPFPPTPSPSPTPMT